MAIKKSCKSCSLNKEGEPLKLERHNSKILLVFQAPGKTEWDNKAPVQNQKSISSAGYKIHKSWERTGKKRNEFDITNTVQCYPGYNEKQKRDKKPNSVTKQCCSNILETDIVNNNYSKIICFGTIAKNQVNNIMNKNKLKIKPIESKHPCARGFKNADLDKLW